MANRLILALSLLLFASAPACAYNEPIPKFVGTGGTTSSSIANRSTDGGVTFNLKEDFGAACNGVTDDTVAIQAWLNKASTGIRLVAPSGTCLFSAPLGVGQVLKYTIAGAGAPQTSFVYTGAALGGSVTAGASWSASTTSITLSASAPATLTVKGTLGVTASTWADNQSCTTGQFSVDANYIYVCTSSSVVKRAALNAF